MDEVSSYVRSDPPSDGKAAPKIVPKARFLAEEELKQKQLPGVRDGMEALARAITERSNNGP
jgi:hypothetical protein